jgi:hypothetical protein
MFDPLDTGSMKEVRSAGVFETVLEFEMVLAMWA